MEGPRLTGIGMTSARTRERLVQRLQEQGITDQRVLDRIRNVPRHLFMDEALATRAYEDTALPIGFGQTISQPYVVARMTEALLAARPARQGARDRHRLRLSDRGALAPGARDLHHRAYRELAGQGAAHACANCGSATCKFRHDDGNVGWAARAPFDGILLTAAPHAVPPALFEQLAVGGRLIAPVGRRGPPGADALHQGRNTDWRASRSAP